MTLDIQFDVTFKKPDDKAITVRMTGRGTNMDEAREDIQLGIDLHTSEDGWELTSCEPSAVAY